MARFATDPKSKIQDRTAAQPATEIPGDDLQHQQGPPAPDHENSRPTASEPNVPARSEANEPAANAADGEAACPERGEAATDSAPRQAKPKRKYTVSDKVRAASPANLKQARKKYVFTEARRAASMKALEKANAAPPEKRNRFTMLRLLARYANLCLAHLKLGPPGKRSPSHIYSGTSCRHLEHSVALAGEKKTELEAHRDRFQKAFRPRGREESRLVDGMADAAWRLLRLFGVRSRWEKRAVQFRLLLAIGHRQAGHQMGPEDAVTMVHRLLTDLGNLFGVYEEQRRLRKRLEELGRAFLSERMGAPSSFRFFMSAGSRLPDFENLPDFALSNPYLSPGEAQEAAEQEAAGATNLKDPREWAGQPEEDESWGVSSRRSAVGSTSVDDWYEDLEDKSTFAPISHREQKKFLLHRLLQASGFNDELDQAGFERLLALAFGIDDCQLENGNWKMETGEDGNPPPVSDCPADEIGSAKIENGEDETQDSRAETTSGGRVSNFQFPVSSSADDGRPTLADVAAALWARLAMCPNWRESAARELDAALEQASGPEGVGSWQPKPPQNPPKTYRQGAEDESPHWAWRALVALVLSVFGCDLEMMDQAGDLGDEVRWEFYHFLCWRYRTRDPFNGLIPARPHEGSWSYSMPGYAGRYLRSVYAKGVKVTTVRRL
jgi:hypothetical protein